MGKKLFTLGILLALLIALPAVSLYTPGMVIPQAKNVRDLPMFRPEKFNGHFRMPHIAEIDRILKKEGILLPGESPTVVKNVVQDFMQEWGKRNPVTPNPVKLRELLTKERMAAQADQEQESSDISSQATESEENNGIKILAVPVEFAGTDTFTYSVLDPETGVCIDTVATTEGPLHNKILPPGPRDNFTLWYEDTTPELYEELFFAEGPDAGVIVNHPNLGTLDLRGLTAANYYLEQSEGKFRLNGTIYPKWLQSARSEGWYGADNCGDFQGQKVRELVTEVIALINEDDPDFPWQDYDSDGDGFVDNFTVIHAGMGQEGGGGAQGTFAIWSVAGAVGWPNGCLACSAGSTGCPDGDIHVLECSIDPENISIGVIAEEFGHAAFGLPDLYTYDYQTSIANWSIMEAGAWNGPLGSMQPAPFPLWFRYIIGWSDPVDLNYDTDPTLIKVGQHSLRPKGTKSGIKVNLPDRVLITPNPLGTGQAWWSDKGNLMQNTLEHVFDLTGTTAPIFSFASYWSIEEDWDYGYVEVSVDNGSTWSILQDMDGILTGTNPNGTNEGWGLTGVNMGMLRFDLSGFSGQEIILRLRYSTDTAMQWDGWWVDDFFIVDGAIDIFSDDVEAGPGGWTANGWLVVPFTGIYPRYYLVEWRNLSGFDEGLKYPYQTVWYNVSEEGVVEWEVDRAPYTVPGMLVWFRDTAYDLDYTLSDSLEDPPSLGPKHGLLVVDSHPFPYSFDTIFYPNGQPVMASGRVQPADAAFTLQDTMPFTIRMGFDIYLEEYVEVPLETKIFGPRPGINQFHDSLGYYPGFFWNGGQYIYLWDLDASCVIPAQDNYTTKITDMNYNPLYPFYGIDIGVTVLGSGNPGDDDVQFGLNMAVEKEAKDGSWGLIRVWNSPAVFELAKSVNKDTASPGELLRYTLKVKNLTPVLQSFVLDDPIPEHTSFVGAAHYDSATNSIHWEGIAGPKSELKINFLVRIDSDTPVGTIIMNEAYLKDDALGGRASATTEVGHSSVSTSDSTTSTY